MRHSLKSGDEILRSIVTTPAGGQMEATPFVKIGPPTRWALGTVEVVPGVYGATAPHAKKGETIVILTKETPANWITLRVTSVRGEVVVVEPGRTGTVRDLLALISERMQAERPKAELTLTEPFSARTLARTINRPVKKVLDRALQRAGVMLTIDSMVDPGLAERIARSLGVTLTVVRAADAAAIRYTAPILSDAAPARPATAMASAMPAELAEQAEEFAAAQHRTEREPRQRNPHGKKARKAKKAAAV